MHSSEKIFNRSIFILKQEKIFKNDFEISFDLYSKTLGKYHFGKSALEDYMINRYILQPLMDPDIKKIKFNINNITSHDLIAYIYTRFAPDLIHFPFQGKRILNLKSIRKAKKINNNYKPYKKKLDYNKNFYIDNNRISPANFTKKNENAYYYLKKLYKSSEYIKILNNLYDVNVYNWANEYSYKAKYNSLEHQDALLAIAITLNNLKLNERYLNNSNNNHRYKY